MGDCEKGLPSEMGDSVIIEEDDFTGLWVSKKDSFSVLLVLSNSPSPYITSNLFQDLKHLLKELPI